MGSQKISPSVSWSEKNTRKVKIRRENKFYIEFNYKNKYLKKLQETF